MDSAVFHKSKFCESANGITDYPVIHKAFLDMNETEANFLFRSLTMKEGLDTSKCMDQEYKKFNDGFTHLYHNIPTHILNDENAKCTGNLSLYNKNKSSNSTSFNKLPSTYTKDDAVKNDGLFSLFGLNRTNCSTDQVLKSSKINSFINKSSSVPLTSKDNCSEDSNDTRTSSFNTLSNCEKHLTNYQSGFIKPSLFDNDKQRDNKIYNFNSSSVKQDNSNEFNLILNYKNYNCNDIINNHNLTNTNLNKDNISENNTEEKIKPATAKNALSVSELTPEILALIPRDEAGELLSYGSIGHASGTCKACVFFHNPANVCQNKERCLFCHYPHVPKKRMRLSKKKRAELRSIPQQNTIQTGDNPINITTNNVSTYLNVIRNQMTKDNLSVSQKGNMKSNIPDDDILFLSAKVKKMVLDKNQNDFNLTTPGESFSTTFTSSSDIFWDDRQPFTKNNEFLTTTDMLSSKTNHQSEYLWNSLPNFLSKNEQTESFDFLNDKNITTESSNKQDLSFIQNYLECLIKPENKNNPTEKFESSCEKFSSFIPMDALLDTSSCDFRENLLSQENFFPASNVNSSIFR